MLSKVICLLVTSTIGVQVGAEQGGKRGRAKATPTMPDFKGETFSIEPKENLNKSCCSQSTEKRYCLFTQKAPDGMDQDGFAEY